MLNKNLILIKNLTIKETKRFSRFKQRGNSENKTFKENYFERTLKITINQEEKRDLVLNLIEF